MRILYFHISVTKTDLITNLTFHSVSINPLGSAIAWQPDVNSHNYDPRYDSNTENKHRKISKFYTCKL